MTAWLWVYLGLGFSALCIAVAVAATRRRRPWPDIHVGNAMAGTFAAALTEALDPPAPALPAARVVRGGR
jgi:hypothetical protein